MGRGWTRKIPAALAALAVVAGLAYGFWPRPLAVDAAPAARGPLEVAIREDGKTRVRERYVVSAPIGGQLLRVRLKAGDRVFQGETPLALIEPNPPTLLDERLLAEAEAKVRAYQAASEQSAAALLRAREAESLARAEFTRVRRLRETAREAVTQQEFDEAEHRQRMAAADTRSAEFARQVAEYEWELAKAALIQARPASDAPRESGPLAPSDASRAFKLVSPVHGKVLRVIQESAAVVSAGAPLLELGDPADLEMEIDVLSTDAVRVAPGAKVLVEHWGGREPLQGVVRMVEPSAFLKVSALGVEEQRVNVIADFIDPLSRRETLGDGYRVEAKIIVRRVENALKVPAGALFRHEGRWAVFRLEGQRAALTLVEVGETNGLETEIRGGLAPGAAVIVHPSDQVRDGVAAKPRE